MSYEIILERDGARAFLPANSDQLAKIYNEHPDAVIVAGATDVGLWVTKMHSPFTRNHFS